MKELTPFFDQDANMTIHAREGGYAEFIFQEVDGTPRDVSESSMFFEVEGFRKQLLPHGTETETMVLIIERGELNAWIKKLTTYVILDETDTLPFVVVAGNLRVNGWA